MYELNAMVCGLVKGLLSMCGVMGLHMCISLLDINWGYEKGLTRIYVEWNKHMCKLTMVYYNGVCRLD